MNLVISHATEVDIPQLAQVLTEAMDYKNEHGDNTWGFEPYTETDIKQLMEQGDVLVARSDHRAIGSLLLQWQDIAVWGEQPPNSAYIHQLAISKIAHGKKIGQQLIQTAADEARIRGRQFLRLDCATANKALNEYYENQGFILVATKPNPYGRGDSLSSYYQLDL